MCFRPGVRVDCPSVPEYHFSVVCGPNCFYFGLIYVSFSFRSLIYLTNAKQASVLEDIGSAVIGMAIYFDGTRMKLYVDGALNNDAEVIARCVDVFSA